MVFGFGGRTLVFQLSTHISPIPTIPGPPRWDCNGKGGERGERDAINCALIIPESCSQGKDNTLSVTATAPNTILIVDPVFVWWP